MAASTDLHIVTGKGGTGKTTVAAALAMAAAGGGRRVLLCEVEGRQGIAQVFDVPPLPYEEKRIAGGLGGGSVYALAIDPEAALLEYLAMYYRLGRAGKALDKFGIIDFATTIAPGVRDVLLTGKVYEAAKRRDKDNEFAYDAVVVDAPPTGRITRFLGVNDDVAGLTRVGPIKNQSTSVMTMMRAPQTRVHLVTLLEEMPVQETLDAIGELSHEGLNVGHVVVNMARPTLITDPHDLATVDIAEVGRVLKSVGLPPQSAEALMLDGRAHVERQQLQAEQYALLIEADRPVVDLPMLADGVDLAALYELAETLTPVVRS